MSGRNFPAALRGRTGPPLLFALVIAAIAALAWSARAPLLQGTAGLWIGAQEPVEPADAIVVLGGGIDVRPFAAADYYRNGYAKRVLVSNARATRTERLQILPPHGEVNRTVLLRLGVPGDAIELFGAANRNTREEAVALREWIDRTRSRAIIVPTEIFSARRVRWTIEQALQGSGARVQVTAFDTDDYGRADWWQHDLGLIAFNNEVLKYLYYLLRY